MSVTISWTKELVDGAEAEIKTVVSQLESVYKDKLAEFKADWSDVVNPPPPSATTPVDTTGGTDAGSASTVAAPVATPVEDTATAASAPVDPTVPTGNVVETSTGVTTTPTGETLQQEAQKVEGDASTAVTDAATTVKEGESLAEDVITEVKKMEPEVVAGVKTVLGKILEGL